MDLLQREGRYPLPPQAPTTLGVEFSGTIESFGADGHEDFKIGDEVLGLAYGGAYAEYIAVSTKMLVHKPQQLSWEEAAGVPEVSQTHTQSSQTLTPEVDVDHRLASPLPHRRVPSRPERPLARGGILGLDLRYPARQGLRRESHLRDSRVAGEDRFPGARAGRDEGVQLQDAGLGC